MTNHPWDELGRPDDNGCEGQQEVTPSAGEYEVPIVISSKTADLLERAIRIFGLDTDSTIRALLESLDCCGFETPSLLPPHIDSIIGERVREGNFHNRDEAIRHYVMLGLYAEQSATGGCFL